MTADVWKPPRRVPCRTAACQRGEVTRVQVRAFGPVDITWWCVTCGAAWPMYPPGTPEHDASVADLAGWVRGPL